MDDDDEGAITGWLEPGSGMTLASSTTASIPAHTDSRTMT